MTAEVVGSPTGVQDPSCPVLSSVANQDDQALGTSLLISLPVELLIKIMIHLDWNDILRIRKVCRRLHGASTDRSIWLRCFFTESETTTVRMLWPEKPLDLYRSSELEHLVLRHKSAELGWITDDDRPARERRVMETTQNVFKSILMIPGGRWLLVSLHQVVQYCDLDEVNMVLRPLIQSSVALESYTVDECVLDVGAHSAPSLSSFNIALGWHDIGFRKDSLIQIWKISTVLDDQNRATGLMAERLVSFSQSQRLSASCLSLLENEVLYSLRRTEGIEVPMFVVVDWTKADGVLNFSRQCFAGVGEVAYLLPNNRVVVGGWGCHLFRYSSAPIKNHFYPYLVPVVELFEETIRIAPMVTYFSSGTTYITYSYQNVLLSLTLPYDSPDYCYDDLNSEWRIFTHKSARKTSNSMMMPIYGYRRGVEIDDESQSVWLITHYPDSRQQLPLGKEGTKTPLFVLKHPISLSVEGGSRWAMDESSGRVVVMNCQSIQVLDFALLFKES